jgi:hypothetical protein
MRQLNQQDSKRQDYEFTEKAYDPSLQIDRPMKLTRERIDLLLQPQNAFIPLIGRTSELAELNAFCDDPAAFRWKVLTGSPGIGKTRLALELAKSREQSGWHAGFLSAYSLKSWVENNHFQTWAPTRDTLIIIDHAATTVGALKVLLARCARWADERTVNIRLRLVLLEREAHPEGGKFHEHDWLHGLVTSRQGSLRDQIQGALGPSRNLCRRVGPTRSSPS